MISRRTREMKGTATVTVRAPKSYQAQQVRPAPDVSYHSEDSIVINGFPQVPDLWVRGTSITSAEGEKLTKRMDPVEMDMRSHSRFLPNGFDERAGVWRPFYTEGVDYFWRAPAGLSPHRETLEYRIGRELFRRDALRFEPGDYLISSFNNGMDDAISFTIFMVLAPYSPGGYTLFSTQDDEGRAYMSLGSGCTLTYGSTKVKVSSSTQINVTPVYAAIQVGNGRVQGWYGTSTRDLAVNGFKDPDVDVQQMKFLLGKTHTGKAAAAMSLMEFDLYNGFLTDPEVYQRLAILSSIYGSTS